VDGLQDGEVSDREVVPADGLDLAKEEVLEIPLPRERDLILTLLLLPWTEREPSSIDSADDMPCPRSSVFLQLEQYGCSTGCTTLDVPEAEQLQLSLSYRLTPLSWFCSSLKPIHSGLTVIRLMTAFGLSAG